MDQRPDRLTAHPTVHSVSSRNQQRSETGDSSRQCKPFPLSDRSRTTASLAVDERHAAAEMDGGHGLRQPMSPAISASAVVPQQRQMQLHHHPARPAIADLFTLYLGVSTSLVPNYPPSEGVLLAITLGVCGLQMNSKQRAEDPSRESS